MENKCPSQEIEIKQDREIINTDSLNFPWTSDPNGYFLVKLENEEIHCGFVNHKNKMILELHGKNPDKMVKEIVKRKICNENNLAYIAQELIIAYYCMKNNKNYIQR